MAIPVIMVTTKRQKKPTVAALRLATLLKKRLGHRCFPVNFVKFLRIVCFIEQLQWVPLERRGTAQKIKFPIKDYFCKYDQIFRKPRIWSHLLKKFLTEHFSFCAVGGHYYEMI